MSAGSFLARHRTICEVIEEIRTTCKSAYGSADFETLVDQRINRLCDEAKDYAQRMSAKLQEYKQEKSR